MKRALEGLDALALRGHEDVEILGESGQPVHVDGHGAEDGVADTLPLQRPEHPDHGIGLHRPQDSGFWAEVDLRSR